MPTYEYECSKCGIVFDHFQSMKDEPLSACVHPEGCRHPRAKAKVNRLLGTGAGIIFKGSGFYETDYRGKAYHEAAKKDKEAASGSSAASETKPEKPKAKSEKKAAKAAAD